MAAFAGGGLSVLVGVLVLLDPGYYLFESPLDILVAATEGAALISLLLALAGVHVVQRDASGRFGRTAFLMSSIGLVMAGAGHLAALPFFVFVNTGGMAYVLIGLMQGVPLVGGTVYLVGTVLLSAGLVLLGVATFRARKLPIWCGPVLVIGLVALWTLGNAGGWISFGIAWIAVAQAIRIAVARASGHRSLGIT